MSSIWNLFKEMEQLQHQLGELSNVSFDKWPRLAFLPGVSSKHFPMMNISSDEQNLYLEALSPGLDVETLKIDALRDKISLSGEKKKPEIEDNRFHRKERGAGKFSRTIELPIAIDPDKVTAEYTDGMLIVTMPKAEEVKPKQISVKID